ncbi:MAG: L,D-transpeptidase [Devosia sp.]|nr:L,D-transpeptidase [Devosia sp.]
MSQWFKAAASGIAFLAALGGLSDSAFAYERFQLRPMWAPPAGNYGQAPFVRRQQNRYRINPAFFRQVVSFPTVEKSGAIIIDTGHKFLYLVLGNGSALRYGIGTARQGFEWNGIHHITNKREWPDWTPPAEMIARQPGIPHHMNGGLDNPLGARALYIGSTLYRIHGTNEPWTIGGDVSSGCIRMTNDDVIDLYGRAQIGAKVIVL